MMKTVTWFLLSLLLGGSSLVEAQLNSSIFVGCGNTKTCFMAVPSSCNTECTGPDCDLVAVIEDIPAESKFRIQLHSDRGYSYMALGFSNDRRMEFSDVVGCDKSDASTANAKDTYNVAGFANTFDTDQSALSNFSFSITGDIFSCQFDRTYLSPPNAGGFALNGTFTLLLGARNGGVSPANSRFEMHTDTPCISSAPVNLLVPNPVLSSGSDFTLVKVHGSLMLFAWMVLVPIAIFMAGYTKYIFPNGEWFHAHRILNISAIVITLAGIAIIFIYVEGWSSGSPSILVHQILGLALISVMLLNPLVALFRCSTKSRLRWIFCLVHSFLGYGGVCLAINTLLWGLVVYSNKFANKRIPEFVFAFWIVIGWVAIEFSLYISLIFYRILKGKYQDRQEDTLVKEKPESEDYLFKTLKHNFLCLPLCPPLSDRKKAAKEWPLIGILLLAFIVFSLLCLAGCLVSIVRAT